MGLRAGFDYLLTSNDILSFGARVGDRTSDHDANQGYDEWTSLAPEPVIYTNSTERERSGYFYAIHSNYQHKFGMKGHELSARLSWNHRESDEMSTNALLNNAAEITEGPAATPKMAPAAISVRGSIMSVRSLKHQKWSLATPPMLIIRPTTPHFLNSIQM
ncbi:MAG: hypothetical protein R3C26_03645 [Calditrichia bacterium]